MFSNKDRIPDKFNIYEISLWKIKVCLESIQQDLLIWADDKELSFNDKTIMCQIVIDNFKTQFGMPTESQN